MSITIQIPVCWVMPNGDLIPVRSGDERPEGAYRTDEFQSFQIGGNPMVGVLKTGERITYPRVEKA